MSRQTQRPTIANVRTHTTRRVSSAQAKHELYMKLTSLEIERSRRDSERRAMLERVEAIERRLAAIEAEQSAIHVLLSSDPRTPESAVTPHDKRSGRINLSY